MEATKIKIMNGSPQKVKLWTKNFVLLTFINFLTAITFYFLIPTLPNFASTYFEANEAEIGYILGAYTLAAWFIRPIAGLALDTWHKKSIYLNSMLVFIVLTPLYYLSTGFVVLLLIRALHGFSWGVITTAGSAIVSDDIPLQRRGEGIGFYTLSFTVGLAIGPSIGLLIVDNFGYVFLFSFSTIILLISYFLGYYADYHQAHEPEKHVFHLDWRTAVSKNVMPLAWVLFFISLPYGAIMSFINIYATSLNLEYGTLFFVIYALGLTVVRPIAGRYYDKIGPKYIIIFALIILIIGLLGIAYTINDTVFLVSAFITGFGMGAIIPTVMAMSFNVVTAQRRGVASSMCFSAMDAGLGVGAVVFGYIIQHTNFFFMFLSSALIVIIPLLFFSFYVLGHYQKKRKEVGH